MEKEQPTNEEIVEKIQQGEDVTDNMEKLFTNNEPLIHMIVSEVPHEQQDDEDCMQVAYLGLHRAAQSFDCSKGFRFMSYAGRVIKTELVKYLYGKSNGELSPHFILVAHKIEKFRNDFRNQYGIEPQKYTILHALGISEQTYKACMKAAHDTTVVSMNAVISESDRDSATIGDIVADQTNYIDDLLENEAHKEAAKTIWKCVDELPDNESQVIKAHYRDGLSFREIEMNSGMNYSSVARCHKNATRELKKRPEVRSAAEILDIIDSAYRGSVSTFNRTWTSSTEYAAIELAEPGAFTKH